MNVAYYVPNSSAALVGDHKYLPTSLNHHCRHQLTISMMMNPATKNSAANPTHSSQVCGISLPALYATRRVL